MIWKIVQLHLLILLTNLVKIGIMKDKIANITRWILYLLLALSVIPGVMFYAGMLDTELFS